MKLIKNDMYFLLIDEEAKINVGDKNIIALCRDFDEPYIITLDNVEEEDIEHCDCKIIAYYPLTKEAQELDLPLLPPFEEINIYNIAISKTMFPNDIFEEMKNSSQNDYLLEEEFGITNLTRYREVLGFVDGYKEAQSDKQFSLKDMKKALSEAFKASQEDYQITADEIISSLSTQQLPKEFIPEYKKQFIRYDESVASYKGDGFLADSEELKTITNSKGKQVLVGTYKY